jgi:fatty acid desaturase
MSVLLTREELRRLCGVHVRQSLLAIGWTWGWIAASFALFIAYPGVLTWILAAVIVSGRQMALAVLMHEGAHYLLARDRRVNDRISDWLCATPLLLDTAAYRKIHTQHHRHTWTEDDPDLVYADHYPVSRASFARKVARDLSGISGLKRYYGLARLFAGLDPFGRGCEGRSAAGIVATFVRAQPWFLGWNVAIFAACTAAGNPWAYALVWVVPSLTGLSLIFRLRNIAEHAVVGDPAKKLTQTRTTLAHPLVRFFVAPHNANYHIEHHLYPFLPHDRLPEVHRLLASRGALDDAEIAHGYLSVWRKAASGAGGGRGTARSFIGSVEEAGADG